jgi:hypothetical protein
MAPKTPDVEVIETHGGTAEPRILNAGTMRGTKLFRTECIHFIGRFGPFFFRRRWC